MGNSSLCAKALSTGSSNGGRINGDSSIGSWGNRGGSIGGMGNWGCNSRGSIGGMSNNSLSTEMLSSCSSNSWLISWDNGSVWMSNKAVEWSCGGADGKTTNNDQELHVCDAKVDEELPM